MKRVISLLIAMVMILSMLPGNVIALTNGDEAAADAEVIVITAETAASEAAPAGENAAEAVEPTAEESQEIAVINEVPAEEQPVGEAPAAEEPAADVPAVEEPVAEAPAAEEPAAEEPAAEEPAAEAPVTEDPAAEEPAEPDAEVPELLAEEIAELAEEAPETYDVTVTVQYASTGGNRPQTSQARNVQVTVTGALEDGSTGTVATAYTSNNGTATFNLPAGTYTVSTSWTSGSYTYSGSQTITVPDATSATITAEGIYSASSAEEIYNRTETFNHIDIRVNGNFTYNGETYNITLRNPTITLVDNGTTSTRSFTSNTSYEWRWTGLRVSKNAVISVTFDIYLDGQLAYEDYTVTYSGKDAFVYAIQICDGHQGLDFRVSEERIIQAVLYNVSYQWDGEYPASAVLPGATGGYKSGDTHTIDTSIPVGTQVLDTTSGYVYTFQGWNNWSDEDTPKTPVTGSALEITSDTIIYGYWTKEALPLAEGYITLSKTFSGDHPAAAEGLKFQITAPDGTVTEVTYAQAAAGYQIPVTQEGTWTITELNADVEGYTRTTMAGETAGDTAAVVVDLPYAAEVEGPVDLGSVAYTNSYEKRLGEPVHSLPSLSITKVDGADNAPLAGAVFTLKGTDYEVTAASGADGIVTFTQIPEGTYTLTETTAPAGYVGSGTEYTVVVTQTGSQENLVDGVFVTTYSYSAAINGEPTLTVANEKIKGGLTITKAFDITPPAGTEIKLTVTGPDAYTTTITLDGAVDAVETGAWTATLSDLLPGVYTVTEISSTTPGYDWTGADFAVTGSVANGAASGNGYSFELVAGANTAATAASLTVTNRYEAWDKATFQIRKVDAGDSSVTLAGVQFGLYAGETQVAVATTNSDGIAVFGGLDTEGTYTLKEISTLNDYVLSDKTWTVKVGHAAGQDGKTDYVVTILDGYTVVEGGTLTVTNKQKLGQLTVTKAFGEMDELPEADRIAVILNITGPDGYEKAVSLDGKVDEVETAPWSATLTGLKLGAYTVTEDEADAAIPGYVLTTAYSVEGAIEVTAANETVPAAVTVTNTYDKQETDVNTPVEFVISKKSADGTKALAGAEFTLYSADGQIVTVATTNADGRASFSISVNPDEVTDAATFSKVFTLKETKAPEGYVQSDAEWKITVALKDGKIEVRVNEAENVFESIYNWIISKIDPDHDYTANVLTIYNDPTELTITKTEKWYLDGKEVSYEDVSGYKAQDRTYSFTVDWVLGDKSGSETAVIHLGDADKSNDVAVITGIPVGASYTVTEADGDYVTEYVGGTGTMAEAVEVQVTNTYRYSLDTSLSVNLKKIDADDRFAMPGIDFVLTDAEGGTVAKATSGENGALGFEITGAGTYYILEADTPKGYEKLDPIELVVVQKVSADESGVTVYLEIDTLDLEAAYGTYLIKNQAKRVDVSVTKKWDYPSDVVKAPGSVEMVLYRNGEAYDTVTLSESNDWTYTWEDLPAYDEWEVDEEDVPKGFYRTRTHSGNDWVITNCATDIPKTGDNSQVVLLTIVMAMSLTALVVLVLGRKRYGKR